MAQSREDRIYLAYKANKKASFANEERALLAHFYAVMFICKVFKLNYLEAQGIVNARRDDNVKKTKK